MCVRYANKPNVSSLNFPMYDRHQTLLRMEDEDRSSLRVQVSVVESLGIHIVFSDYQHGDAPVLLVNCLRNRSIVYYQQEDP